MSLNPNVICQLEVPIDVALTPKWCVQALAETLSSLTSWLEEKMRCSHCTTGHSRSKSHSPFSAVFILCLKKRRLALTPVMQTRRTTNFSDLLNIYVSEAED
ncbi:hypothetical protein [Allocoleopsis franciscana]|uniref:Uncharacterized protein n=1 Tax=Allocoleopsis franciscana PCC 7113 TaxID=1173027 RepID=K9WAL1_9CYAN|nr:hypothetical protein [Allocoleopsis franciscana]AFZ17268.1 hypothetical protein Mic7113_1385 [Allocoleopsis franciscana PCC 7113]